MMGGMTSVEDRTGAKSVSGGDGSPRLSRYQVHQRLAVGGMAEIFVAQKHGSPDVCVVKQLHSHLAEDGVVGARFLREAQVASLLNHPHIARLTDAAREAGNFYLAMEHIAGQDVETMMFRLMEQRKMLPPELSVTVTLDVLEGLDYAHDLKSDEGKHLEIVHRDLSPRNVMVTYDGRVKIIDFGLARTNLGDFRTAPGMVLGTMRYMSPEQAVAEPVDRRSDIYSWSVVLYEMLSGRPLVMGANPQEVLHAVVTQVPPPLSSLNPALPRALDAVLEKGLAKDRRDRFSTAGELRHALIQAAGPLGALDDERHQLIGRFVRELFPAEHAETTAMLESLEKGEGMYEPTRLGPAQHEVTRATYVQRIQQLASAAVAVEEHAPMPEIVPLVPGAEYDAPEPQPISQLTPVLVRSGYRPRPEEIEKQRKMAVVSVAIVGFAMFLAGGAAVYMLTRQEPPTVLEVVDTEPKVTATEKPAIVAVKKEDAPPLEKKAPAVEEKRAAPQKRSAEKTERAERRENDAAKVEPKSALPEVQRIKRVFSDVYEALERAKREVEKLGDEPLTVDIEPLTLAVDLIRAHSASLAPDRRDPVSSCLRGIDFGDATERLKKARRCYEKLEEAAQ